MKTEIDWSAWPADAEIFIPNQQGTSECVAKFDNSGAVFFAYSKNVAWTRWSGESKKFLLERFRYTPKAWDGEGWPPVGAECEMSLFAEDKWELCTPAYYLNQPDDHSDQVVVYQNSLGGDVCYILDPPCSGSIQFRPIRTPEQIEAQRKKNFLGKLNQLWDADTARSDFMEAVYEIILEERKQATND